MLRSDPDALRNERERQGHSTRTLARKVTQESGRLLSHAAIVRLEGGAVPVKPDTAHRLARALGCKVTDIATVIPDQEVAS